MCGMDKKNIKNKPRCISIIGLSIVAVKGWRTDKRIKNNIEPEYILFSDGETYIELAEQDYYSNHDCSFSARHINFWKDKSKWEEIFKNEHGYYPDATTDI